MVGYICVAHPYIHATVIGGTAIAYTRNLYISIDSLHAKPRHDYTRMVDDDEPVTYHHASKLLAAISDSLENLGVLTETAKKANTEAFEILGNNEKDMFCLKNRTR